MRVAPGVEKLAGLTFYVLSSCPHLFPLSPSCLFISWSILAFLGDILLWIGVRRWTDRLRICTSIDLCMKCYRHTSAHVPMPDTCDRCVYSPVPLYLVGLDTQNPNTRLCIHLTPLGKATSNTLGQTKNEDTASQRKVSRKWLEAWNIIPFAERRLTPEMPHTNAS
jgi:hypothetical protein